MTFAVARAGSGPDKTLKVEGWPGIGLNEARVLMRIGGTVTNERLEEALLNAMDTVATELASWRQGRETLDDRQNRLFRRAACSYAQAELIERYPNIDITNAGVKRAEEMDNSADDARRAWRWAVSDMQGLPRLTVELM